jgi:hypothetical protein
VIETPARRPTKAAPPVEDVPTFEMEEPPKAPPTQSAKPKAPQPTAPAPPEDQKYEGDIGELEKQFEDEDKNKPKKEPTTKSSDDDDLDDILAKLTSFEDTDKGGGAK